MRLHHVVGLLAVLAASPAAAEVTTFARASGWEAFGGTASDGRTVCGVSVQADGSWFALKYFKGDPNLTVQLGDDDWRGKAGETVTVDMRFDKQKPWTATATAFDLQGKIALEFPIDADQITVWMDEFMESYNLYVAFPNAKVGDWHADLKGTKNIGQNMVECIGWMSKRK